MNQSKRIRTYSELMQLSTFEERFNYLKLNGVVGQDTFGYNRYLNQKFYQNDPRWLKVRDYVIIRDGACDLGIEGRDIYGTVIVHHMNPITEEDLLNNTEYLLDPEYLITIADPTHKAIHYGDETFLQRNQVVTRTHNDTSPWKK